MIRLGENQSAEPRRCGSCNHFRHRQPEYDTVGRCSLRLPPWVPVAAKLDPDWLDENGDGGRAVQDTDGCDLWTPRLENGVTAQFEQRRIWTAGTTSR